MPRTKGKKSKRNLFLNCNPGNLMPEVVVPKIIILNCTETSKFSFIQTQKASLFIQKIPSFFPWKMEKWVKKDNFPN